MEENQDVNVEPSTTEEGVQEPVEETTEQTTPAEEETPEQPEATPEVVKPQGEVDEMGVPYKNRYMEMKRKYDEVNANLPSVVQEAVQRAIPQQPQAQPQYTEEQLIQYKNESDDARAKAWAEMELRKIDDRKAEQKFRTIVEERDTKLRKEQEANMAFQTVRNKYSVAFNQDGSPNMSHPLTQMTVQRYNSDPALKNDSRGLLKAADMAFADYVLQQSPHMAKQQKQLKRQVKRLEKATLTEGGGQSVIQSKKNPLAQAKAEFASKKFNSEKDLQKVTKELLKARKMV